MKAALRRLLTLVVDWEWLWLFCLLPAILLIRPNLTPLLLLLSLLWLARKLAYGRFTPRHAP